MLKSASLDAFPAVLLDANLGPATEDHDHVVGLITFRYEPGPGRERARRCDRPERVPFDRVQCLPEDDRGGIGSPRSGLIRPSTGKRRTQLCPMGCGFCVIDLLQAGLPPGYQATDRPCQIAQEAAAAAATIFRGTGIPDSRYIMRFGKPGGQVHDATSFRDIAIGQERYLGSRLASGSNSCVGSRTGTSVRLKPQACRQYLD